MTESTSAKPRRWVWVAAILVFLPIAVIASWMGTEHLIASTSGAKFCATCHAMEPMIQSYLRSEHGGNNRLGIQVDCVGCHLPHDSPAGYLFAKARVGLKDVWAQLTLDPEKIDWHAYRAKRREFVYDSGCLKCHGEMAHSTRPDHPAYFAGGVNPFAGQEKFQCVSCHFDVGHKDLAHWIRASAKR